MDVNVLIPTFNRAKWTELQIQSLVSLRSSLIKHDIYISITISDNCSEIPPRIPEFAKDFCKIIKPEKHLFTAEENLKFGIENCFGEYVWMLGDDDAIIKENAIEMLLRIKRFSPDFLIANASGALASGELISSRTRASNPGSISDVPSFLQRTGFWFVAAGFSCLVAKLDTLSANLDIFDLYSSESRIYSHVFWFSDIFWDKKFAYFEKPIVLYKQNMTDLTPQLHWNNIAKHLNVFPSFFWSLGFVNHALILRNRKKLEIGFFSRVIDQNWQCRRGLLVLVLEAFFLALEDRARSNNSNIKIKDDEIEKVIQFLIEEQPRFLDIIALSLRGNIQDAGVQINKYKNELFYNMYFVENYYFWNIYFFDNCYRAVPENTELEMRFFFEDIAPLSSPNSRVESSLEELKKNILASPEFKFDANIKFKNKTPLFSDQQYRALILLSKTIVKFYKTFKYLIPHSLLKRLFV
jgi:hypothetical protein